MSTSVATLLIQHQVQSGVESQYEAWLNEIVPAAQHFIGHIGVNILRLAGDVDAFTIVDECVELCVNGALADRSMRILTLQ